LSSAVLRFTSYFNSEKSLLILFMIFTNQTKKKDTKEALVFKLTIDLRTGKPTKDAEYREDEDEEDFVDYITNRMEQLCLK
jgi:hypothetical protein